MITVTMDNDILIKGAAYELLAQLVGVVPANESSVGLLGAARYIVPNRIKKMGLNKNPELAIANFEHLAQKASFLEPTEKESELAGQLELHAKQINVSLDAGESQLLAITILRSLEKLITGDKRAVVAMQLLEKNGYDLNGVKGKILCLEQLLQKLFALMNKQELRSHICGEPNVDKTLSICFSCTAGNMNEDSWIEV